MLMCDYCYVKEIREDSERIICKDCIQSEFYIFDNMKAYLKAFDLVNDYYNEMETKIFSYILMREYINEDADHFIDWSYKNAEHEKALLIMKEKHS